MSMKKPPLKENLEEIGTIDISNVQNVLNNKPELWNECKYRQENFKPHKDTESIICVWSGRTATGPQVIRYENNYNLFKSFINELLVLLKNHFKWQKDIFIYKAMFAKLKAKSNISPHIDRFPLLRRPQRIHVPIFTEDDKVYTKINDTTYHLKSGTIYNFNNTKRHSIENTSTKDRVNFIIDVSEVGTLSHIEKTLISITDLKNSVVKIL